MAPPDDELRDGDASPEEDIPDWLASGDLDSDDALKWIEELAAQVRNAKCEDIPTIGVKWAAKQTADLLENGAPGIHYFVFSNEQLIDQLMEEIKSITSL